MKLSVELTGALETQLAAVAQRLGIAPEQLAAALRDLLATFGGTDLYPALAEKAAALCVSLVGNHPFVDGNKRVGHAALETMLVLNGHELAADVADCEWTMVAPAEIAT